MTRAEMMARMSSREYAEWMAYDQIEPLGTLRADINAALVCATLVNAARAFGGNKGSPARIEDFLLFVPHDEPEPEAMAQAIRDRFTPFLKDGPPG